MITPVIVKKIGRRALNEFYTYISFNATRAERPVIDQYKKIEMYNISDRYNYEYSVHIDRRTAKVEAIFKYTDSAVYLFKV